MGHNGRKGRGEDLQREDSGVAERSDEDWLTHMNGRTHTLTTPRVKVFCINMVRIMKMLAASF